MTDQPKLLFNQNAPQGLIEVWSKDEQRWLEINSIEQTRVNLEHSEQLTSPVQQSLLAALLFIKTPDKVLLGGLGGGALARYLYHVKPEIQGEAVEINETIAKLAKEYFFFPEKQWQIFVDDFRNWNKGRYDLMVVDIADGDLTPSWLCSEAMLLQLKQQLTKYGVLAIDLLVADAQSLSQQLTVIRTIFNRRTLCLSVPDHKNIIVLAFNCQDLSLSYDELNHRAKRLTVEWGIDFSVLLKQLKNDNPKENGVF